MTEFLLLFQRIITTTGCMTLPQIYCHKSQPLALFFIVEFSFHCSGYSVQPHHSYGLGEVIGFMIVWGMWEQQIGQFTQNVNCPWWFFPLKAVAVQTCGGDIHTPILKSRSLFSGGFLLHSLHSFYINSASARIMSSKKMKVRFPGGAAFQQHREGFFLV